MSLTKVNYIDNSTIITAKNLNDIQDNIIELDNNLNDIQDNIIELQDNLENIKIKPKAGFIYPLATDTIPDGFLLCDGAEYSRNEYPELFAAIGTHYGSGNGVSTFNVPNLQTRVPIGASENYELGSIGGEEIHTLTVDEMPTHNHDVEARVSKGITGNSGYVVPKSNDWWIEPLQHIGNTNSIGGSQPHNNMQPYTVVNYIIATGKNAGVNIQDIITGVQALPLGVEYGGTGATNARTARELLEITPENIGAMSMELLWENASPTSEFTDKTVSLDLSEYSAVLIEFHGISEAVTLAKYIKKGNVAHLYVPYNAFYSRTASVNDNGVVFGNCAYPTTYNGWTMQTINSVAIPKTIYGIKGVSA